MLKQQYLTPKRKIQIQRAAFLKAAQNISQLHCIGFKVSQL